MTNIVTGPFAFAEAAAKSRHYLIVVLDGVGWRYGNADRGSFDRDGDTRRDDMLAEVTPLLSASLDYETTVQNVAGLVLSLLSDFGFLDLRDGGKIRRVVWAPGDPVRCVLLQTLATASVGNLPWSTGYSANDEDPSVWALPHGRTAFVPEICVDDEWLQRLGVSPGGATVLRTLEIRSLVSVPLFADADIDAEPEISASPGDSLLGALTFCYGVSGRRYEENDVVFAQTVAQRAASALDHARRFSDACEALDARDEFLVVATNELRAPVATLRGQVESMERIMARDEGIAHQLGHKLRHVHRQVERLHSVIGSLVELVGQTQEIPQRPSRVPRPGRAARVR